ncbi:hypothetical protein CP556_25065 [Natrinema sp. CBA1119]|nr:hypothetical protein CP556_25065 [Natrinema sp. CBA1119]
MTCSSLTLRAVTGLRSQFATDDLAIFRGYLDVILRIDIDDVGLLCDLFPDDLFLCSCSQAAADDVSILDVKLDIISLDVNCIDLISEIRLEDSFLRASRESPYDSTVLEVSFDISVWINIDCIDTASDLLADTLLLAFFLATSLFDTQLPVSTAIKDVAWNLPWTAVVPVVATC